MIVSFEFNVLEKFRTFSSDHVLAYFAIMLTAAAIIIYFAMHINLIVKR